MMNRLMILLLIFSTISFHAVSEDTFKLTGTIIDTGTKKPLAARLYIQREDGIFFYAASSDPTGKAIPYDKQAWNNPNAQEKHVTLSAHPFHIDLPVGKYTVSVEKGKEYLPIEQKIEIDNADVDLILPLQRWSDVSKQGWYSGETHVHRTLDELPTLMAAEDLNVAFPLTYWVTKGYTPPTTDNKAQKENFIAKPNYLDETHVIYPLNTEYEIFTIDDNRHTLGAIFCLNHKTVFTEGVPPVKHIAEKTHDEGGLLELDKHNWEWSMMLIPIMGVDLYELTNNHIWRTEFAFRRFGTLPPDYMNIELDENNEMDEENWIEYGFKNYYALLNCGFRLRPTAGTASGVHPVPFGFGRVYVHIDGEFTYEKWVDGLDKGNSFVTTGPMLDVRVNQNSELPGTLFDTAGTYAIKADINSIHPITRVELIVNGDVLPLSINNSVLSQMDTYRCSVQQSQLIENTSWFALRCIEQLPNGRTRFAHSAPYWVEVEGKPNVPKKVEAAFLVRRIKDEIERNDGVLNDAAMAEYHEALKIYQEIESKAK